MSAPCVEPGQRTTPSHWRSWPAVMGRAEIARRTGKTGPALKLSLNRWVRSGVLRKAGPRSGVFYNLVADPDWQNNIPVAVLKRHPDAVLAGPSVLHAAGCQTQIPSELWIIVSRTGSARFDGVVLMPRPREWQKTVRPAGSVYGLPALSPHQAVEDAKRYPEVTHGWQPDPDDLDLPEQKLTPEKSRHLIR